MTDSGKPNLEARIDRYARGELTPVEARELAQASLESPELFEELTWSAVAKTALPSVPSAKVVRFPRKVWFVASAAAAAVLLISFYVVRPLLAPRKSVDIGTSSQAKPSLPFSAHSGQPLLLATGMDPIQPGTYAFRNFVKPSRDPRPAGSIVLFEDGLATINLGSLDYLSKGSELQIFRDERSIKPIGRMVVTTVFRERARARILGGQQIPINSEVRVAAAVYMGALLEQADAAFQLGHLEEARIKADEAARWAETAGVAPADKGKALEKLAALEYLAGPVNAAENHFQSAAESLGTAPPLEQAAAWNNLAVARLSNGDYAGAEGPLNQAISKSPKTDVVYARSLNNLGVLTELRGDHSKAESLYEDALRALTGIANPPAQERQAIEANLARVKGLH
jgi:Flp pilus assembly protein TadD